MNRSLTPEELEERIEKIKQWTLEHGRLPSKKSRGKDRREYQLYAYSHVLISPSYKLYNLEFREWCIKNEFLVLDRSWGDGQPRGFIRR